jgi:hypothetical protein
MESHNDGARVAIPSSCVNWVALALVRYSELKTTLSVIIFVADVEGKRRIIP